MPYPQVTQFETLAGARGRVEPELALPLEPDSFAVAAPQHSTTERTTTTPAAEIGCRGASGER